MTSPSSRAAESVAPAWSPSLRSVSRPRLISCAVAAVAAVGLLAGCGESAQKMRLVASSTCAPGKGAPTLKLVLTDRAPIPRVPVAVGSTVEVVSHFARQQMTFPAAHPSAAVCELSQQRDRSGAATATYRVMRPGTITFSSTYTHTTSAMMPEMLARLTVAATTKPHTPVWTLPPVTGGLIPSQSGALRIGSRVSSAALDIRSFENRQHGWALAFIDNAQYPAFTSDAEATWRIAGPPLHRNAAQGGVGVGQIGVPSPQSGWRTNTTAFAWGGVTPDSVVDVTLDGGKHWWGAMLPGSVLFVSNEGHELVANVYGTAKKGSVTRTGVWEFATKTGRRWSYIGALSTP